MTAATAGVSARRFLASCMLLSVISGIAIGTGRIVTTFYVMHLGAGAAEIGWIGAAEAAGKMLVTLPAGFLIVRFGARRVYSIATIGSMVLTALTPVMTFVAGVGLMRTLVSFCVPFRVVSMNSAFLQRLPVIGAGRAGWYRGSQSIGLTLLGPMAAAALVAHGNYWLAYGAIALSFAVMAAFSRTFLPDDDEEEKTQQGSMSSAWIDLRTMLWHTEVRESCAIELVSHSVNALFTTFIIVLAVQVLELSSTQAVTLVTLQGVSSIAALFVLGPLVHALSGRVAYWVASVGAIASLALLGWSTRYEGLAFAAVLLSLATGFIHLVNMKELSAVSFTKSKVAGLYNLSGMLGALLGSSIGGILAALLGLRGMFIAWIPVVLVAVLACVIARRRRAAVALPVVSGASS
jgi:MFS family permease